MITDRERKNREELFKLMQENPELPVVAMVDSEIVQDDGYSRWMGAWGSSSIEEYFIGEERIHFREEDDFDEVEETLTDGQVCTDDCLEGADGCDKCDNTYHIGHCWWHPDEREGGNV